MKCKGQDLPLCESGVIPDLSGRLYAVFGHILTVYESGIHNG